MTYSSYRRRKVDRSQQDNAASNWGYLHVTLHNFADLRRNIRSFSLSVGGLANPFSAKGQITGHTKLSTQCYSMLYFVKYLINSLIMWWLAGCCCLGRAGASGQRTRHSPRAGASGQRIRRSPRAGASGQRTRRSPPQRYGIPCCNNGAYNSLMAPPKVSADTWWKVSRCYTHNIIIYHTIGANEALQKSEPYICIHGSRIME